MATESYRYMRVGRDATFKEVQLAYSLGNYDYAHCRTCEGATVLAPVKRKSPPRPRLDGAMGRWVLLEKIEGRDCEGSQTD